MIVKKSTQISNRNANADFVISSLVTHGAQIVAGLHAHGAGLPAEEQLGEPEIARFLGWLGALLRRQNQALAAAELDYVQEQADDPAVRVRRDESAAPLLTRASRVRARVESVLGSEGLATYGMSNHVPRVPADLAEYTHVAIQLLRKKPMSTSDSIGGTFDTAVLAAALEDGLAPLRQALDALTQEQRELEAAMLTRNQALSAWVETYQSVATALTALYRLAGHTELAQRVRPTTRRSTGLEPPLPDDSATGEPGADPVLDEPETTTA